MIYRIILKVSYYEVHFDFASAEEATKFAETALIHMVSSEDAKKASYILMKVIAPDFEESEDE